MYYPIFPYSKGEAEKAGVKYSSETNRNAFFPATLRMLRDIRGVSQAQFALDVDITKSTASLYEQGDTVPDIKTLARIAEYYDVSADYLLGLSEFSSKNMQQTPASSLGLTEYATRVLIDTNELAKGHLHDKGAKSRLVLISEIIIQQSLLGSLHNALQYIVVNVPTDETQVNFTIKDLDGNNTNFNITADGALRMLRNLAIEDYGKILDRLREQTQQVRQSESQMRGKANGEHQED